MLALLEVRIRKAKKNLIKLRFLKEVGQELHRVCANTRCILVGTGCDILDAQGAYFLLYVLCDRSPDLQACLLVNSVPGL